MGAVTQGGAHHWAQGGAHHGSQGGAHHGALPLRGRVFAALSLIIVLFMALNRITPAPLERQIRGPVPLGMTALAAYVMAV